MISPTPENGLKKISLIRTNKIATLDKALVLSLFGQLTHEEIADLYEKLIRLFRLKMDFP